MEIIGNVFKIWNPETYVSRSGKSGEKRKLTVRQQMYDRFTGQETGDENFVTIEFFGDKVKLLDNFKLGQTVIVYFELTGSYKKDDKTGEEKCFTFINGRNIYEYGNKKQATAQPQAQPQPTAQPQQYQQQPQQRQYTKPEPQQQYQSNEFFDSLQSASEQGGTFPD